MTAKGTYWSPSSISVLLFVPACLLVRTCYSKFRFVLEGGSVNVPFIYPAYSCPFLISWALVVQCWLRSMEGALCYCLSVSCFISNVAVRMVCATVQFMCHCAVHVSLCSLCATVQFMCHCPVYVPLSSSRATLQFMCHCPVHMPLCSSCVTVQFMCHCAVYVPLCSSCATVLLWRQENVTQLRAHIVKLCRALSEDLCRKVVTNARVRLQEVVRQNGGHVEYVLH